MASHDSLESDSLTLYEKQGELKRILESKHFAKAPMRRRFLEFTSGQVFRGEDNKLNEYLIGVEVYERGENFDSQQDPIVRVQAHEIRRALKNYYQEEGKNSLVKIELPAGQYAPVFRRVKIELDEQATPIFQREPPPAELIGPASNRQRATLVFLSLACVALGLLFIRERFFSRQTPDSRPLASALPESGEWFWKPFLAPGRQPLLIVPTCPLLRLGTDGDSPQTLREGNTIPKSKIPEFHDTTQFRELKNFIFVPTTTDFTGIGEAFGLVNLSQFFAGQGMMIRVKTGRLTDYAEIQSGNTIILGGGNAWTNRVFINPPGFSVSGGVFKNDFPGPGEPSEYTPKFDSVTNRLSQDYALILMGPNHTTQERLLFLYGLYTQGTEAAAEYVTNAERLAELHKALLALSPDRKTTPAFFEVLLSVPVENYVPGGASLVAVRIIPR